MAGARGTQRAAPSRSERLAPEHAPADEARAPQPPYPQRGPIEIDPAELNAFCLAVAERARSGDVVLPPLSGGAQTLSDAVTEAFGKLEGERAALRRFAGDAAHQLRTPLAVLSARIEAPVETWNADQLRADLGWMGRLIDQLLTASKASSTTIDAGETFDLRMLATDVVSALAPLAIYRGRAVALDGKSEQDPVLGSNALAFEALSNLVENALDHTPEGTTVSVMSRGDGSVEVRDRGAGVPPEEQATIFRRFSQGQRRTAGGAGLGLSIVTEIMDKHQGAVRYRDRRGGGAIFSLHFQRVAPSGSRQEAALPTPP